MKSKRTKALVALTFVLALAAGVLAGCSSGQLDTLLGGSVGFTLVKTPKFMVAIDATSGATTNVNVFPVNATTGVLGAAVSGSPFDRGLSNGMVVMVHPNGHWVYVADCDTGMIHQWTVDTNTGVPTDIAPAVANESGSFYAPSDCDDSPTRVITITPNGKFLYASDNDAMVSEYSINASTGALSHIGDVTVTGATVTGAIVANDSFVWVTDTVGSSGPWHVMTLSIGSNGALTNKTTADLAGVFSWLWSIAVSPDGKVVQVGDEGGDAQVYSFTVATDGSLTQVGPQVVLTSSSDARFISFSPDGKFFYVSDDDDETHAVMQNTNGSMTELGASPYSFGASTEDGQVEADLTGKFVFVGGEIAGVAAYTRDSVTGALTPIGLTPTANGGQTMGIGLVRVAP
jgi:6-phosphogluconolactonase (cycloisomerase 2 family)